MTLHFEKEQLFPCLIAALCILPLFSYTLFPGRAELCIIGTVMALCGLTALIALLFWRIKKGHPQRFWFWVLMVTGTFGLFVLFFLEYLIKQAELLEHHSLEKLTYSFTVLVFLFLAIHFLFPMVHILLETRKRKKWFRYLLFCIYIFSLFMGNTILFLGKMSYVEFFPIAALSGCLLEFSFLWTKQAS